MPLFTASARAKSDGDRIEVIQLVVATYDPDHAFDLEEEAIQRQDHSTLLRGKLRMSDLTLDNTTEQPVTCVVTDARSLFTNILNGPYYGTYTDASLYRNAVS